MSSSSICQGVRECFDPLLVQQRVLGLALFSFVQPLSPGPACAGFPATKDYEGIPYPVTCQDARAYVHPLVTRSGSVLSEKSLDVCTESLGCETGSDDFLGEEEEAEKSQMCPVFVNDRCSGGGELKSRKGNRSGPCSFPPPLKSMRGSSMVRMQPCRYDGRLVLQAVEVSPCRDSFLVERGGGRLRLSVYREQDETEDDGEEEGARATIKGGQESEEDEEKVSPRRRPSRCKEGKGQMMWKPRWVAT